MSDTDPNKRTLPGPKPPAGAKSSAGSPASTPPVSGGELPPLRKRPGSSATRTDQYNATNINDGSTPVARTPLGPKPGTRTPASSASRFGATRIGEAIPQASAGTSETVADRYEILRLIAEGGMGMVWLARDMRVGGRFVAIKRLNEESLEKPQLRARFDAEASTMAKLHSPNTIRIVDKGEDAAGPYICVEYIPGPKRSERDLAAINWTGAGLPSPPMTLQDYVDLNGPRSLADAVTILDKMCESISEAHSLGIVHRDIKPANVLVNELLDVRVIDFGLVRELSPEQSLHTQANAQMLTIGYGAPEQERNAGSADERADIYALGATLWFLVTGKNPRFFRSSEAPLEIRSLLDEALAPEPRNRVQTVKDLQSRLAPFAREKSITPNAAQSAPGISTGDNIRRHVQKILGLVEAHRTVGTCPYCAHAHVPVPASGSDRQYCAGCGANLWISCPSCKSKRKKVEVGVWERCCKVCAADVFEQARTFLSAIVESMPTEQNTRGGDPLLFDKWAEEARANLKQFVDNYGMGKISGQPGTLLKNLESELQSFVLRGKQTLVNEGEDAWTVASRENTEASYTLFLEKFPGSPNVAEAAARVDFLRTKTALQKKISDKTHEGLLPLIEQARHREPGLLTQWPDSKAAALFNHDKSKESAVAYLRLYPSGKVAEQAAAVATDGYRDLLVQSPEDRVARGIYLAHRNSDAEDADFRRASGFIVLFSVILATLVATGAYVAMRTDSSVFIVAALSGLAALIPTILWAIFAGLWSQYGPLPAFCYALPWFALPRKYRPLPPATTLDSGDARSSSPT